MRMNIIGLAVCVSLVTACAETTSTCGEGESVAVGESNFCVYKEKIVIVGGFNCPAAMPFRRDFERATVCGDHGFDHINIEEDICARVLVPCTPPQESDASFGVARCGSRVCEPPHATGACRGDQCMVATCDEGFGDCDGNPDNGCEASLETLAHCGSCGNECTGGCCERGMCTLCEQLPLIDCSDGTCSLPGAIGVCLIPFLPTTSCIVGQCLPGFGNCNKLNSDGCETTLRGCGSCNCECVPEVCDRLDNDCDALIDEGCTAYVGDAGACQPDFGDCDGDPANGCETSLLTETNCGACNNMCALANADAVCISGRCDLAACDVGFGNCDANLSNGCERPLNTLSDCGGCGVVCVGSTCESGTCVTP